MSKNHKIYYFDLNKIMKSFLNDNSIEVDLPKLPFILIIYSKIFKSQKSLEKLKKIS